jgi:hypothetical protein
MINTLWAENHISDDDFAKLDVTLMDARHEIEQLTELLGVKAPETLRKFEEMKKRLNDRRA